MHVFIRTASSSSLIFSHFQLTAAKFKDLAKFVSFAEIFFYYFSSNTLQLFALENLPYASQALGSMSLYFKN